MHARRTSHNPRHHQPQLHHVAFFSRHLNIPHTASTSAPIEAATASVAPAASASPSDAVARLIVTFLGQFSAQIYSGESQARSHTPKPLPWPFLLASDRRCNRVCCASGRHPPSDAVTRLIVVFLGQLSAQIYTGASPARSHTPKPPPRPLLSASDRCCNRVRCASGRHPPSYAVARLIVAFLGHQMAQIYTGESPARSHPRNLFRGLSFGARSTPQARPLHQRPLPHHPMP
jgi:hypothetical protein